MDWVRIHLLINHFAVVLAATGTLATLLALGRSRRGIWLYATASLSLAAVMVIPTYLTGRAALQMARSARYTPLADVGAHTDAGQIASVLLLVAGLVAMVGWRRLVRYPREVRMPGTLRAALLVSALAAAAGMGYTWALGARAVHVAPGLAPASPPATP